MTRHLLAITTMAGLLLVASPTLARADEIDACANAYETAQRHHKAGELKASIIDATTCAREICPEILKKDCQSWLTTWRAEEKEKEPKTKPATAPAPSPSPAPAPPSAKEKESPAKDEPSRPVPALTYVVGGVGILALGVATGFMLNGVNVRNDLDRKQCRPSCESDEVDRARTSFLVADIFGVVGALAVGGALVIYLTRPEANAKTGSVSISPYAGGASLRATF